MAKKKLNSNTIVIGLLVIVVIGMLSAKFKSSDNEIIVELPTRDQCEDYCTDEGYNQGGYPGECDLSWPNERILDTGLNCCCVWMDE